MATALPGSWRIEERFVTTEHNGRFRAGHYIMDANGVYLALAWESTPIATVRAMAAAPEMLEALEAMLGFHDCDCDFCHMALAAIAKAKGEQEAEPQEV